ncbi:MAG: hypothetical protein R3E08_08420 [Thiotrichaceae bacterium]
MATCRILWLSASYFCQSSDSVAGNAEQLLENLAQLADSEVDELLKQLLK